MSLTVEQAQAADAINGFMRGPGTVFTLTGYAGTGKSYLLAHDSLHASLAGAVVVAPTWKAAAVLRDRGIQASTFHSLVYGAPAEMYRCSTCNVKHYTKQIPQTERNGKLCLHRDVVRHLEFHPTDRPTATGQVVIVDEASMVNDRMLRDLLDARPAKVLLVGDPFQLPPVQGNSCLADRQIDAALTQVMRTSLDSPILALATQVREQQWGSVPGGHPAIGYNLPGGDSTVVIVATHQDRRAINNMIRAQALGEEIGRRPQVPLKGEPVLCKSKDLAKGLYNGSKARLLADAEVIHEEVLRLHLDGGRTIHAWTCGFTAAKPDDVLESMDQSLVVRLSRQYSPLMLNYGYAITCHSSQGSEWDNVAVLGSWRFGSKLDSARWLYTGVTRAREKVVVIPR